jgi:hypothetical protein
MLTGSSLLSIHSLDLPLKEKTIRAGYGPRPNRKIPQYTRYYENILRAEVQRDAELTEGNTIDMQIVNAIRNKNTTTIGNSKIIVNGETVKVHLYFDEIAVISYETRKVRVCSVNKSKTIKTRLNRILMHFTGTKLFQKDQKWFISSALELHPFDLIMEVPMI